GLMARNFRKLGAPIDADPERRGRVDEYKRAMYHALALVKMRENRKITQKEMAEALDVTQANISRIEHQEDIYLSTLSGYVQALGGRLEIRAVFPDQTIGIPAKLRSAK
ncbi:MAG: XRE family transcriptional regulator, partial [Candidatus Saccharimonadales bacterium]